MPADAAFSINMDAYGSSYDTQWHCVDEHRFILLQTHGGFDEERTPLSTLYTTATTTGGQVDRWCLFDIFELSRVEEVGEQKPSLQIMPTPLAGSKRSAGVVMEEKDEGAKRRRSEIMADMTTTMRNEWLWEQITKDSYYSTDTNSATNTRQEEEVLKKWMATSSIGHTLSPLYNGKLYIVYPSEVCFEGDYAASFDLSRRSFSPPLLRVLPDARGCSFPEHFNLSINEMPYAVFENALYILVWRGSDDGTIPMLATELWRLRIESTTHRHRNGEVEKVLQWTRLLFDMPLLEDTTRCTMACTPDGALYLYDYSEGEENDTGLHHNPHHQQDLLPRCSCCGGEAFGAEPPFFGRIRRLWLIRAPTLKNLATRAVMRRIAVATTSHSPTHPATAEAATASTTTSSHLCLDCQCQNLPTLSAILHEEKRIV